MERSRKRKADRRGMERRRLERRRQAHGSARYVPPGRMIIIAAAILVVAVTAGYGIWSHTASEHDGGGGANPAALTERDEERDAFSDYQAGAVSLTGLTTEEAERKFKEAYRWGMEVVNGEERVPVEDLTGSWAARIAEQIRRGELPAEGSTAPDYAAIEEKVRAFARELGKRWDKSPVDSQVEAYNKETKVYTYTQEENGRTLNQEALTDAVMEAVRTGRLTAEIRPEFTETPPARTRQQAKEQYRVIGTFETKTTDNKNRNQNIRLAVEAIDGMVIQPGEEFSFNSTTGNRTAEKGYQPAGAYKNGILIEEPGGGVCQVSTTLYHAIIEAGYKTTERNAHSFAPSYVEQGQDAMVSFDGYAGPDLKFVNTGNAAVVLRAAFDGKKLKLSIVGLPILEEGVTVSIRSEKVSDVDAPAPVYEENPSLPYGTEQTVDAGKDGSVWKSYRVTLKDGKILEETPLHNSYYKPKTAVIQKNTLAPPAEPVPEEAEVNQPTEAAPESDGELAGTLGEPAKEPLSESLKAPSEGVQEGMSGPAGEAARP